METLVIVTVAHLRIRESLSSVFMEITAAVRNNAAADQAGRIAGRTSPTICQPFGVRSKFVVVYGSFERDQGDLLMVLQKQVGVAPNQTAGVTQVLVHPLTRVPFWYRFLSHGQVD